MFINIFAYTQIQMHFRINFKAYDIQKQTQC